MKIAHFDTSIKPLLIAEIGNNHEGSLSNARKLVEKAKESGADAVKFQTFRTEHYVSRSDKERFARLKSFELSYQNFEELAELARTKGLIFISTPFDVESAKFLSKIVDAFKIASGDINFYPLIKEVCNHDLPVIFSTGLSGTPLIEKTYNYILQTKEGLGLQAQLAILHCVSAYPAPMNELNLRSIPFLKEKFLCPVGYSDHAAGNEASLAAAYMGAEIIEKHFTLDKNFSSFRDHQLSADPSDLLKLRKGLDLAHAMLGDFHKKVQPSEESSLIAARRSIAVSRDIPAGTILTEKDLTWIRPATGIPPGEEKMVIGKSLNKALHAGDILQKEFLN